MDQDHQARPGGPGNTSAEGRLPASAPLIFDAERYRQHVVHLDMSEAQKDELLAAVWQIMRSFVDRAFGEDAAQLARISGDSRPAKREANGSDAVGLSHTPQPDQRAGLSGVFRRASKGD